jgi:hypothetical protein
LLIVAESLVVETVIFPFQKQSCSSLEAFSDHLNRLHQRGFVNAGHHDPRALKPFEYFICTLQGCRQCGNKTGLSIISRELVLKALSASELSPIYSYSSKTKSVRVERASR